MHDFLTEPWLPAVVAGHATRLSLPGLLAALSAPSGIDEFPGLAAHQRQAWFHFLVQLAAITMARAGTERLPEEEAAWRERLAALTPGEAETAWSLVVADHACPALFQPPTAKFDEMRTCISTPDALDVLQTAKNHDVKSSCIGLPEPHHWFYALLTLQTMQGYSGRGNFGIARMNGGFGSRALVELTPSMAWGERFRRGARVALEQRRFVLTSTDYEDTFAENGLALLWLAGWDDETSLDLAQLDPCFIEVCRRVRLAATPGGTIGAVSRSSQVERIAAKEARGVLGDPFVPVKRDGAALTVAAAGFDYRLISDILTDANKYALPASFHERPEDPAGEMLMHFAVLVRGQGKTEGLHDRIVPVSRTIRRNILADSERKSLNEWAQEMIETITKGAKAALKNGVLALVQAPAPSEKLDFKRPDAGPWLDRLDRRIDEIFLPHLFARAAATDATRDTTRVEWQRTLAQETLRLFEEACEAAPSPGARRERAVAVAANMFEAILNHNLPLLHGRAVKDAA